MTFETSALIIAWVAIALISFAMSGIFLQVGRLTRTLGLGPPTRLPGSTVGLRLPEGSPFSPINGTSASAVFLLSPACSGCRAVVAQIESVVGGDLSHTELNWLVDNVEIVFASIGNCPETTAEPPFDIRYIENAEKEIDWFRLPGTPGLGLVAGDGTILGARLVSDQSVGKWIVSLLGFQDLELPNEGRVISR